MGKPAKVPQIKLPKAHQLGVLDIFESYITAQQQPQLESSIKHRHKFFPIATRQKYSLDANPNFRTTNTAQRNKALIVLPCGSGKTFIGYLAALKYAEIKKTSLTTVLVPNRNLIKQTMQAYMSDDLTYGIQREWLCIADDSQNKRQLASQLFDVNVTTSAAEVTEFLNSTSERHKVVFCTYQSAISALYAGFKKSKLKNLGFVIFDEVHKTGVSHELVTDSKYTFSDRSFYNAFRQIPFEFRLSMTATPGTMLDCHNEVDDQLDTGECIFDMLFREAAELNLIYDFNTELLELNEKDYDIEDEHLQSYLTTLRQHYDLTAEKINELYYHARAVLNSMHEASTTRKMIVYHHEIAESRAFTEILKNISLDCPVHGKTLCCFHVDGDNMSDLDAFQKCPRTTPSVISNCKALTDGIDIQDLDSAYLASYRSSPNELMQLIGRIVRYEQHPIPGAKKTKARFIIPVLHNFSCAEDSNLQTVRKMLNIADFLRGKDGHFAQTLSRRKRASSSTSTRSTRKVESGLVLSAALRKAFAEEYSRTQISKYSSEKFLQLFHSVSTILPTISNDARFQYTRLMTSSLSKVDKIRILTHFVESMVIQYGSIISKSTDFETDTFNLLHYLKDTTPESVVSRISKATSLSKVYCSFEELLSLNSRAELKAYYTTSGTKFNLQHEYSQHCCKLMSNADEQLIQKRQKRVTTNTKKRTGRVKIIR